jgi:ABC-2 type transport system ATP-binding protein
LIEAKDLTMYYGPVVALEHASFQVRQGEVVGLLGPNGAGKSTTLKILTTYLWPTSGEAFVCGKSIFKEPLEVRKRIGYLPEVLPLYTDMEVGTYLQFVGRARGLGGKDLASRMDWVTERCGLKVMLRTPVRELSKGYRQRTALAQALIHNPEVVILDEPTSGLDPHQIIEIRGLIKELAKTKTVILSTHILAEVEAVSDRIIIISRGRIVADGSIEGLRKKAMKLQRVELTVAAEPKEVESMIGTVRSARMTRLVDKTDAGARFQVEGDREANLLRDLAEGVRGKGWELNELRDMPFSLEETFLALTEAEASMVRKGGAA